VPVAVVPAEFGVGFVVLAGVALHVGVAERAGGVQGHV